MSARAGVIAFVLAAVLGIIALLLGAGGDGRSTAFSLDIPPAGPVATLHKGRVACQGPFTTRATFGRVTVWLSPIQAPGQIHAAAFPGPDMTLTVRDALTGAELATGRIVGGFRRPIAPDVGLTRDVPVGQRVQVCLRAQGLTNVQVLGAPLATPVIAADAGSLNGSGKTAIALLFIRRHPKSLLSLVPTVFRRASLFRPGWIEPWTYWVLSAAFLGAFALGGVALARAVRSDTANEPRAELPRDDRNPKTTTLRR